MKKLLIIFTIILILIFAQSTIYAYVLLTAFSSTSDGTVSKLSTTWSISREATNGDTLIDDTNFSVAGAEFYSDKFVVYKSALYFNTSSIPADATITGVTLYLYGRNNWSTQDFDIVIQNGMPTYPHDPMEMGDFNMTHYSGDGGSVNTTGWSIEGYNLITLNVTGESWIQKGAGAVTKLCLRSSKDIDNIEPTDESTVSFWSAEEEETGERRPKLVVNYTGGSTYNFFGYNSN